MSYVSTASPVVSERSERHEHRDHNLAIWMLTLGMTASFATLVVFRRSALEQADADPAMYLAVITKPASYYVAHAVEVMTLLAAGLLALMKTGWRQISARYLSVFLALCAAGLLMMVRGYGSADILSTKLLDWTGPFPILISVLLFVGAQRENWRHINSVLEASGLVLSAFTAWIILTLPSFSRDSAVLNLTNVLNALYWPAVWVTLSEPSTSGMRLLRFVPMMMYAVGTLFTQTRLNVLMIVGAALAYSYAQRRRGYQTLCTWSFAFLAVGAVVSFGFVFFRDSQLWQVLERVTADFYDRLGDDTRSGQLISFVQSVEPSELIWGRGSLAAWSWAGMTGEYFGGTDVGYLTLLFMGGLPLLLTYVAAHLWPAVKVLMRGVDDWRLPSALIVMLWGLRMWSSSYPTLGLDYYPVLLCVGACASTQRSAIKW